MYVKDNNNQDYNTHYNMSKSCNDINYNNKKMIVSNPSNI